MNNNDGLVSDITFLELFLSITLGWILVDVWARYIDNLTFNVFGLDKRSAFHTFVIAISLTSIFLVFIFSFQLLSDENHGNIPPPGIDMPHLNGKMNSKKSKISKSERKINNLK